MSEGDGLGRPLEQQDFGRAIHPHRDDRPAKSTIHVQAMAMFLVHATGAPMATWRQPERGDVRNPPLSGVAVSAQREVGLVLRGELIENIRRVREDQGEPSWSL